MGTAIHVTAETIAQADELARIGAIFYAKNWSLATSSNYSCVVSDEPLLLLMTGSGLHKGELSRKDFALVNDEATVVCNVDPESTPLRASAEAALHVAIVRATGARSVLHTHSVYATLLSARHCHQGRLPIGGWEMLKALEGIKTHETEIALPIYRNTQDITSLAAQLTRDELTSAHGFLIEGHGLYTWGASIQEARRHVEALEFLLEVTARANAIGNTDWTIQ